MLSMYKIHENSIPIKKYNNNIDHFRGDSRDLMGFMEGFQEIKGYLNGFVDFMRISIV